MKHKKTPSSEASGTVLPWNMPMYRIGDYAKYLGVTPDFLKHYEQFRFVTSETNGNGYRYYPFGQSYKILECMRLRNYGMSLRDIDVALVDDDPDTLMEKLDARVCAIEQQIRFEQAIVRNTGRCANGMRK